MPFWIAHAPPRPVGSRVMSACWPDKLNEMMQDPELAAVMQKAGVTGTPEVFIAT